MFSGRIVGYSEVGQHLFRTLCANCVPDSEDTQIRRNGESDFRPISSFPINFQVARHLPAFAVGA
jgi:hypothetical protein